MSKSLMAGVARTIISPPKGIYLIGYGDRTKGNLGVHDDLTATALVLARGQTTVAIVALDILTINEFIVDEVRANLAPIEVILCCSHTHSGPISYADQRSGRKNQDYIHFLVKQICTAVRTAQAKLRPAQLEFSQGEAEVGINRREMMADGHMEIGRNPDGVRDRSLQVLSVFEIGSESTRMAVLVNYACHGTVLGPDNLLVSADWIGAMRGRVETELGGYALFLQGAAANINPDMFWEDEHAFEKVQEQGLRVAESVLAAIQAGSLAIPVELLRLERAEAWLPTEAPVSTAKPPRSYRKPLLAMAKLPGFLAVFSDLLLRARYPWRSVIAANDGYWSVPMRINVVRIGELALVTYAAETFTEIGLKVKAFSPASQTLFASVSDGCISYLHTAESHLEGGYEVDVAPLAYRYPGRLAARGESIALEETRQMLANLWDLEPEKEMGDNKK